MAFLVVLIVESSSSYGILEHLSRSGWFGAPRFWTMPITGLLPASEYVVGIRGVNAVGEGAESLGAPWAVCVCTSLARGWAHH